MSLDPIRAHERACAVCGRKEWVVMDLIAQGRGHASWTALLEWGEGERAWQPELPLECAR